MKPYCEQHKFAVYVRLARLYFPEGTSEDHIDRAAFELESNAAAAIKMNRDPTVRGVCLDRARLAKAAQDMRAAMLDLLANHGPQSVSPTSIRD